VAWPEPAVPDDSAGELADELLVLLPVSESDVVDELVVLPDVEAAWAATPAAIVPPMLAATNAAVMAVVRVSPRSRSMESPSSLTTQRIVARHPRPRLCRT
jgi:hypothetical protein